MNGKSPNDFSCKWKDQAVTLASKNAVRIKGEPVQIDPNLMFQRLASSIVKLDDNLGDALKHELCTFPPALFESFVVLMKHRNLSLLT